ncbi:MAG: trk system potassium uptake protein TrkA [Acidimicrobiales bacterium]|jgi:trk system potassium uptake protein
MHVLIIGAGEIGFYLAQRLEAEHHDVVVVDKDSVRCSAIAAQLDVQVITGNGGSPAILERARIDKADLVAAVTDLDEVNLITSLLAKEYGVETTVVRLQSEELRGEASGNLLKRVGADLVIDPDADTADEILELVHSTGADEIYPMAGGDLVVIGGFITAGAPLAGRFLKDIAAEYEPNWEFLFGAVTRNGDTSIPRGDQKLLAGDHVRVLATRRARGQILDLLGVPGQRARRVLILGGGAIGTRVATRLQAEGVEVVLIERDPERAEALAEELHRTVVVQGDITDTELLHEEGVGSFDAVVAAAGEDSHNVLACAFAASEGARFTVAVLHRLALLPLVRRFGINAALSPRTASANAVLRHVRGGTSAVATFLESDSEVDEIEIEPGSRADGSVVSGLGLPHNILIGAVIRPGASAEIVRGKTILRAGDHIVVFARPDDLAVVKEFFAR